MLYVFQKGFHMDQDGPGNRLVIHLHGCNLACPWCANPEGLFPNPDGKAYEETALLEEILSCDPLFIDGGGVTFSGGEPTMQWAGLFTVLRMLKDAGVNTAIETNGTHPDLPELFPLLDHLIVDCKHYDEKKLKSVTKADLRLIAKNLKAANDAGISTLVRTPLINGFNADEKDAEGFVNFYQSIGIKPDPRFRFEFLLYHEYGKVKWEKCGVPYTVKNAAVPPHRREFFENVYKANGYPVIRT